MGFIQDVAGLGKTVVKGASHGVDVAAHAAANAAQTVDQGARDASSYMFGNPNVLPWVVDPFVGTASVVNHIWNPSTPSTQLTGQPRQDVLDAINSGNRIVTRMTPKGMVAVPPAKTAIVKRNPNPAATIYPGGAPPATANPNQGGPTTTAGVNQPGVGGGGVIPIQLIDPNQFQVDTKAQDQLTKAILATLNIDTRGLSKQAAKQARQAIAQNVAQLVAQQTAIRAEGERVAKAYSLGSTAAAKLNADLPQILNENYSRAAQVLGGLAQGFSTNLQNTAEAQAGGNTGLPPGSQMVTPWGERVDGTQLPTAMHDAVYGAAANTLGGLTTAGLAAGQVAAQLPRILTGQGLASAQMARGAAEQAAENLIPDIRSQQAQLPTLTQQNYNALVSAEQKSANAKASALGKLMSLAGMTPYQVASLRERALASNQSSIIAANRANASQLGAAAKLSGPKYHFYQDPATGLTKYTDMNPQSPTYGQGGTLPGTPKTPAGKTLTPNEMDTIWGKVQDAVTAAAGGSWYGPTTSGGVASQLPKSQPLSPNTIWTRMLQKHPGVFANPAARQLLLDEINSAYQGTVLQPAVKGAMNAIPYPQLVLRNGRLYYQGGGTGANRWILASDAPQMGTPPIAGAVPPG